MTTFGSWPLLERVTNDEFLELLPYFSLEEYFLTQVFVPKKKWIQLLDANMQTLQIKCGVCFRQIRFEDIKNHLKENDHLMSLRSIVKQFYHPFYTYGKGDIKLARGEQIPQEMLDKALREVNNQMRSFNKECTIAKEFADTAERRIRGMEEDQLIESILRERIKNPEDMIVMVGLPFEDIPKLLFCVIGGEWQTVLSYRSLTRKTFYCNICKVNCFGFENVNDHLNGLTHRVKQLEVLALRYEDSSRVNKNCCIRFGCPFSFSIKEDASTFLNSSQLENNSDVWITKLPTDIKKKIKALNEHVLKIWPKGSLEHMDKKNDLERNGKFEYNEILGHLGVEYVLKIIKNENDRNPRFECGLCEFVGDAKKMQSHLLFYEHKKKYLDLHYSDTIKKYENTIGHMCYKDFCIVMNEVVNKVAIEIEKHHSRSLPYTVLLTDYKVRRPDLIAEVYALLHASQNRGPSFSNVLLKEDIKNLRNSVKYLTESKVSEDTEYIVFTTAPKSKIYLNQMNKDPVVRLMEYNAKLNRNRKPKPSRSISPTQTQLFDTRRSDLHTERSSRTRVQERRTRSRSPIYTRSRTPTQNPQVDAFQTSNEFNYNIWDIYRREIAFSANEIEIAYENYRKNPESHPLYEEEWNNFWQHRKKELEREGCNHRSYNFQPEWVHYFKQRIEVLFGEALHNSMINIRHRLEIPLDAEEDCQRSHESLIQYGGRGIKDCVGEENHEYKRHKLRGATDLKRCVSYNKKLSDQMQGQGKGDLSIREALVVSKINDNHSDVIHVLRLMTALEDHLGSLGGKVMDLLSSALQLEKNCTGNNAEFESRVLTSANCHLIETAMEKLKGVLFAGLLEEKKISGFNRVVQHTSNLLKYAEKMGWRKEDNVSEKITLRDNYDRAEVTQQDDENVSQVRKEKALSDTLMDIVSSPQASTSAKEKFESYRKEPDCPPPPNIREENINNNVFAGFKRQQTHSGLASFNTKLSLDNANQLQRNLSLRSENGQFHRGGNNLYNNSFKNNNDTRTNIRTRTINEPSVEGVMHNNDGAPQFRNSQLVPNVCQNNSVYQSGGGGNRNRNWLQWNRMN